MIKKLVVAMIFLVAARQTLVGQISTKFMCATESHVSFSPTTFTNARAKNVPRYSSDFTNLVIIEHVKFSDKFGISVKTGLNNYGLINKINDSIKLKQRAYIVPLGFQINMGDAALKHFFIGAELAYVLHYKEKTWLNKESKQKFHEWNSSRTNTFVPAFFMGYQFNKTNYVQLRYQPNNLINPNYDFNFKGVSTRVNNSSIFSVTFGTLFIGNQIKSAEFKPLDDAKDIEIAI